MRIVLARIAMDRTNPNQCNSLSLGFQIRSFYFLPDLLEHRLVSDCLCILECTSRPLLISVNALLIQLRLLVSNHNHRLVLHAKITPDIAFFPQKSTSRCSLCEQFIVVKNRFSISWSRLFSKYWNRPLSTAAQSFSGCTTLECM